MRVVTSFSPLQHGRPAILTIGAFDGVHRGHQFLIQHVVDRARELHCDSIVITFDPRPEVVLRPGSTQLTGADEKIRIIRSLAPTTLAVLPFNRDLSQVPAGQFLREMSQGITIREVWIGSDFAFGHNREGNVDFLRTAGQTQGFSVHVVARHSLEGQELSSSAVRRHLETGEVESAARLLGHYFRVSGVVVRGTGRGVGLGYPTANLRVAETQMIPGSGIYAAFADVEDRYLQAAVSVGTNPTFGDQDLTIEPHLLDFDGDLRDRSLALDFVRKVRDEARFENRDLLVAQIGRDVAEIRRILSSAHAPGNVLLGAGE